jgi:peptide/nickel transport system substrate-binding protein
VRQGYLFFTLYKPGPGAQFEKKEEKDMRVLKVKTVLDNKRREEAKMKKETKMKKGTFCLMIVGCLMALTLALSNVQAEMVKDSLGRSVEKPQYGGTITFVQTEGTFDPHGSQVAHDGLVFQGLLLWDYAKGPTGTGDYAFDGWFFPLEQKVGGLAESWELINQTTAIYHIRKGVRWQKGAPVNGRELVADDVVYSFKNSQDHPKSLMYKKPGKPRITARALDKYTVEVKLPAPNVRGWNKIGNELIVIPPEVKAAGLNWDDWKTSVGTGTGPYILEKFVEGASYNFRRNPDYWQFDPLHPKNRLPYPDTMKGLVITDLSTQLAALRTGKIDHLSANNLGFMQRKSLSKTNPELRNKRRFHDKHLWFRLDKGIFTDKRVRQALNMAVDNEKIVHELYEGQATWWVWPYAPDWDVYIPREELPPKIKEIYTYNPEKAKRLLAKAGYPNGFKFEVTASSAMRQINDILAIYKNYFQAIGVDMKINQVERGQFWDIIGGGEFKDSTASPFGVVDPYYVWDVVSNPNHYWNNTKAGDQFMAKKMKEMASIGSQAERNRMLKEIGLYWFEKASVINLPVPNLYTFWQPWLKNYGGEFVCSIENAYSDCLTYGWVDQKLKKKMGH